MPVYFAKPVGMDGPVKIGFTQIPPERLKALMNWCPFPLEFAAKAPGGMVEEGRLHFKFRRSRKWSEWFDPSPELSDFINDVNRTGALPWPGCAHSRVPLKGLPAVLRRIGMAPSDFAAYCGFAAANIPQIVTVGSTTGAGKVMQALEELGFPHSFEEITNRCEAAE